MAPSVTVTTVTENAVHAGQDGPRKRAKLHHASPEREEEAAVVSHPLNVKPSGNAMTSHTNAKHRAGRFALLTDELVMLLLESLEATDLLRMGHTCKYLYAFASFDELWRALFIRSHPADFSWRRTWRATLLNFPETYTPRFDCGHVFSDLLHRPFYCSVTPLGRFAQDVPKENLISRLPDLTLDGFNAHWVDQPFILTSPIREWPAFKTWNKQSLSTKYGQTKFRAEAVDWQLKTYFHYMDNSTDESPLYLFDRDFASKMGTTWERGDPHAEYWPPECFSEDLFSVLDQQRPDCRWLIIGPDRSGSTFHKDPNGTSAWNAVLTGSKYWLMFPSSASLPPPPGVLLSEDQSEITSPLSIAEYLLTFHELARATPGCREGICHAGEVLHVPAGWFHLVLNLDESIAITQNFVPRQKLADVLRFLRDTPDQVSGFKDDVEDPYALFVHRLETHHPQLLDVALEELKRSKPKTSTKWDEVTKKDQTNEGGGEGFGFNFESDEE